MNIDSEERIKIDIDFSDSEEEENSLLDYNYIFVDMQGFKTYQPKIYRK